MAPIWSIFWWERAVMSHSLVSHNSGSWKRAVLATAAECCSAAISGAGKSFLAYACARAGWTYTSDDASFLLNKAVRRQWSATATRLRFRPSALNSSRSGRTRRDTRAAGKPSIEYPL